MKCPFCGLDADKVIDSRPADEGAKIRRRRECQNCHRRFSTYEMVETVPMMVVKKDGSRQMFDRDKILAGMQRACSKRPVSTQRLLAAADDIEQKLLNAFTREVSADRLGQMVMEQLKTIDDVAYIRFASVYREFRDMDSFMQELKQMLDARP